MYAVAALRREQTERRERLPQDLLREHALENGLAAHVDVRLRRRVRRDPIRPLEVVVVVAAPAAERERDRQTGAAPPRAADALLVVEAHRRHVRHHDGEQRADIDAGLHRRRHAQEIDRIGDLNLVRRRKADVLEESLALAAVVLVRLPGELLTVEPKQRAGLRRQIAVVVGRGLSSRQRLRRAKRNVAIRADASRRVQVNPAALAAFEVDRSGPRKAQVLGNEDVLREHARAVEVVQHVAGERLPA